MFTFFLFKITNLVFCPYNLRLELENPSLCLCLKTATEPTASLAKGSESFKSLPTC